MNRTTETRLTRLENASKAGRIFIMWDKSAFGPHCDLEIEKSKFREERGVTPADTVIIVGWRKPRHPDLLL